MTTNPMIQIDSVNGGKTMTFSTYHFNKRRVYLLGEINMEMANQIAAEIRYLEESDSKKPITIYINSPGGEIQAGLVIYDIIQNCKCTIRTICQGIAASMAAYLFAAGTKGERYIYEHSKTMIHEPRIYGGVQGTSTSLQGIAESMLETKNMMDTLLAKHTGKKVKEISKESCFDNWMDANKSIEFGMCDAIVTKETEL